MSAGQEIFDRIRQETEHVAREAHFVHLVDERIAPYAQALVRSREAPPTYDREHHFLGSPADTVAFLLALDSLNFGSGYFPHLRKRAGMSGYFTIASSLKDHWDSRGPLSGRELRAFQPEQCASLFGQLGNAGPVDELMMLFARALNDLGAWLGRRYDDDPLGPIADAGQSASRLVEIASEMPLFRDVARYRGRDVPLYKRAQLLVADLALAFKQCGPGTFADVDRLTVFADNLVPHVLRVDGLLHYDADLLARITRGDLIPCGSAEEVEIRAVAVHAVERLVAELCATGTSTTARRLDFLLWNRGQETAYKSMPRHRTRTTNY